MGFGLQREEVGAVISCTSIPSTTARPHDATIVQDMLRVSRTETTKWMTRLKWKRDKALLKHAINSLGIGEAARFELLKAKVGDKSSF